MRHLISSGVKRVFNYSALDSGITFLPKQQGRNGFLTGLDNVPHHQPQDQEPFCLTGVAILNQLIREGRKRSYLELPEACGEREEGRVDNSHQQQHLMCCPQPASYPVHHSNSTEGKDYKIATYKSRSFGVDHKDSFQPKCWWLECPHQNSC